MHRSAFTYIIALVIHLAFSQHGTGQDISIQLPDTVALGTNSITVPITVNDLTGLDLISLEFTLSYDSTVLRIDNIIKQNYLTEVFALLEFNATQPGKVIVAGASGGTPLSGEGELLAMEFTFLKEGVSDLIFEGFRFDPGDPPVNVTDGRVRNVSLANREEHVSLPSSLTLQGHFPNPANNRMSILLDLHEPAQVGIRVYNSQGQSIRDVPSKQMQSGSHQQLELDVSTLPAGTYYYQIAAHSQRGYRTTTKIFTVIH